MDRFRAAAFLPLSPVSFDILLALVEGEQHGYRILLDVNQRSAGTPLRAGTLYRALARLLEQELIEELTERPAEDDERRRYYRLTQRGMAVAQAEAARLATQLSTARARRLVEDLP
jgi:DNA-binding PadR family transcriptional regulator